MFFSIRHDRNLSRVVLQLDTEHCSWPLLVVKFDHEDLIYKDNLIGQVKRMLKGPYMEDKLKGRLAKAISKGTWFKKF